MLFTGGLHFIQCEINCAVLEEVLSLMDKENLRFGGSDKGLFLMHSTSPMYRAT